MSREPREAASKSACFSHLGSSWSHLPSCRYDDRETASSTPPRGRAPKSLLGWRGEGRVVITGTSRRERRYRRPVVLYRNATPSVFHQRHIGRVLRSSCNSRGRRIASPRDREPRSGRCAPLGPGDLRNDGGSVATAGTDGSEA